MSSKKPVALVSMPTLAAHYPSFQLALLKPTLEREGFEVTPYSLFLYFGHHIGFAFNEVLSRVYPSMVGEWIWSKAAFGKVGDEREYLAGHEASLKRLCAEAGCTFKDLRHVRNKLTFSFLDWALTTIDWASFGLVGFSVVFQQTAATLALAKALKKKHPTLPIILGGASFEEDIAAELMKNCPQVDYLHRGDGDLSFPSMVKKLYAGESMRGVPGLLWRDGGRIVDNGRAPNLQELDRTPVPDFDEYFYARKESGYDQFEGSLEAMIPIETARGCWWGMKNHCTFCGLNRQGMDFRAKSPAQVLGMLGELSTRYKTRHFNAIDNILAPEYVTKLFGALAEAKTDLKLHYEIRPNVPRAQLRAMKAGGLFSVQPGVESLSTHVLTLMKKFTTGMRNLELLKWTTYYGIENYYNILVGFPGETVEDYALQAALMRKVPHFLPPYAITQARPDRGSPMYEEPEAHSIAKLEPSPCYRHIFPEDRFDLRRISYYFEHDTKNILTDEQYAECYALVARWQAWWKGPHRPFLRYAKSWDAIEVEDSRGDTLRTYHCEGPAARLYEACLDARRPEDLATEFQIEGAEWLEANLADFVARDLMVHVDDRYLALALPTNPNH